MFYNGYKHVDGAHEDLQDYSKSFAEVFAPDLVEESADLGDFIAAMVTLGAVGAGAFVQTGKCASQLAIQYFLLTWFYYLSGEGFDQGKAIH